MASSFSSSHGFARTEIRDLDYFLSTLAQDRDKDGIAGAFSLVIAAGTRSGKTHFISSLLARLRETRRIDSMHFFTSTVGLIHEYHGLVDTQRAYNEEDIQALITQCEQRKTEGIFEHTIIIMDDIFDSAASSAASSTVFQTLFTRARHFNVSCILSSQTTTRLVSPTIRANNTHFMFARLPPNALTTLSGELFIDGLYPRGLSPAQQRRAFISWAETLLDESHVFGVIAGDKVFRVKVGADTHPVSSLPELLDAAASPETEHCEMRRYASDAEIEDAFNKLARITRNYDDTCVQLDLYDDLCKELKVEFIAQQRAARFSPIICKLFFAEWSMEKEWTPAQMNQTLAGLKELRTEKKTKIKSNSIQWIISQKKSDKVLRGIVRKNQTSTAMSRLSIAQETAAHAKKEEEKAKAKLAEATAARERADAELALIVAELGV